MGTPSRRAAPSDAIGAESARPHGGIRSAMLIALRDLEVATAHTLSERLDCSLNAVRHHLRDLELGGAVSRELIRQGVGAPAHGYRLTPKGRALFPSRYANTVRLLLDELVALEGRDASAALLGSHFAALGERVCREAGAAPSHQRAETIAAVLDDEGFMASWQSTPDGGVLTEHNCPHHLVAERFPEVCAAEAAFLAQAFGAEVRRESHIMTGCGCCRYQITSRAAEGKES